jgi:hypothetical protein
MLNVDFTNIAPQRILFAAGNIQVRVADSHTPPRPILGAQVEVRDGATPIAQGVTDQNGEVILEVDLSALPLFTPKAVTVVASQDGFAQGAQNATVIAVATIDVDLALVPQ